jgi:hypothetical protein
MKPFAVTVGKAHRVCQQQLPLSHPLLRPATIRSTCSGNLPTCVTALGAGAGGGGVVEGSHSCTVGCTGTSFCMQCQ